MKERDDILEDLEDELEDLEKERRELIFMQGKVNYGTKTYLNLQTEINKIDKKIFVVQEKKYQMSGVKMLLPGNRPMMRQRKNCNRPLTQSEMIKKHNEQVRNTEKKMMRLKGDFY